MKPFILVVIFLCTSKLFAQCDYSPGQFQITSEKKLLYGILPDYQNKQDSLFLDIYYPIGSPESQKPLVIWAFGGGFFQGAREDFASVCENLASRGILSATIDYRLGFDGPYPTLGPPFSYDPAEIVRAGYRGATDMKGAIRFLKDKANQYGIDINRVWLGGASAGSVVALNAAFLDLESEKPKEVGDISPIGTKSRLDLGPIEGVLNQNGQNSSVQGVFNIFGALLDTLEISPTNKIAVFSYHQTQDPVVPCEAKTPYYNYSFIGANYPIVYGTCVITDRLNHIGMDPLYYESWIYPGNQHATHNDDAVINFFIEQAKPFLCKTISQSESAHTSVLDPLEIVPTLVTDEFKLNHLSGIFDYSIYNFSGQLLTRKKQTANTIIDVHTYQPGIYFIEVQKETNHKTLRWIKK